MIGAGFNSQIIYNNITNKEDIVGIVDNDITKQGKYFYNTDFIVQPFTALKNAEMAIVMKNKFWTNEVVKSIYTMNNDISIHYI